VSEVASWYMPSTIAAVVTKILSEIVLSVLILEGYNVLYQEISPPSDSPLGAFTSEVFRL